MTKDATIFQSVSVTLFMNKAEIWSKSIQCAITILFLSFFFKEWTNNNTQQALGIQRKKYLCSMLNEYIYNYI